jgi:hypothetical protein
MISFFCAPLSAAAGSERKMIDTLIDIPCVAVADKKNQATLDSHLDLVNRR